MKAVFFGTHNFAVEILSSLLESKILSIDLVITQPDRSIGRHQELSEPPVKKLASKNNITVIQPETLKGYELPSGFDIGITAQYGILIPESVLNAPKLGIINVHTSLLPKYRGASPIQNALLNGEKITGVTIMKMNKGLDTGDIILQKETSIDEKDNFQTLENKLANLAKVALAEALPLYANQTLIPYPQDNEKATICRELKRDDGKIDFSQNNDQIFNKYRAFTPWPGIWTTINGKRLKLVEVTKVDEAAPEGSMLFKDQNILIGCGNNSAIQVTRIQPEGKRVLTDKEFIQGYLNSNNGKLNT